MATKIDFIGLHELGTIIEIAIRVQSVHPSVASPIHHRTTTKLTYDPFTQL